MSSTLELVARLQAVQDDPQIHCDHMFTAALHDVLQQGGQLTCTRNTHRGIEYSNGAISVHRINGTWHIGHLPF